MYYEIVYEDGTNSVADYPDDDAARGAILEQHNRAKAGAKNGPQGGSATRVVKVFAYKSHPGSLYEAGGVTADELKSQVNALLKGHDVVEPAAFALQVQSITHPMVPNAEVHESKFKMEADHELELSL
jgi:hypothetical protein